MLEQHPAVAVVQALQTLTAMHPQPVLNAPLVSMQLLMRRHALTARRVQLMLTVIHPLHVQTVLRASILRKTSPSTPARNVLQVKLTLTQTLQHHAIAAAVDRTLFLAPLCALCAPAAQLISTGTHPLRVRTAPLILTRREVQTRAQHAQTTQAQTEL